MNKRLALYVLIVMLPSFVSAQNSDQSPRSILESALKRSDIYSAGDVKGFMLVLESIELHKGKEIEHKYLRAKVLKEGERSKLMVRYTAPAGIEGTTYLVHMDLQKKLPEDIWLYLPSFKKTKRITPYKAKKSLPKAIASLSVINSRQLDFDDYDFSNAQEAKLNGKANVVIEMKPKSKQKKAHISVWLEKERGLITKLISKNSKDKIIEEVVFHSYQPYGAYWLPEEVITTDISTEKTMKVVVKKVDLHAVIKLSDFELEEIKNPF